MTKDEIKSLIATKIAGQGTQVDLGNALPTILNEIVDSLPERAPIEIDFSGVEFAEEPVDVTDKMPANYTPMANDAIVTGEEKLLLSGYAKTNEGELYLFGFQETTEGVTAAVEILHGDDKFYAKAFAS